MQTEASLKSAVARLLHPFRRDSRSQPVQGAPRRTIKESYALLRGLGFSPVTVIDVGVADGTPVLYKSFPNAYFLLIEPMPMFEPQLRAICATYRGDFVLAAAGARTGETLFNAHTYHPSGSSLFKQEMGEKADGKEIRVEMIRVDDAVQERALNGPFLIKIDAQGAELAVLRGCDRVLSETEVVVLEVSFFRFLKGAPEFHEVIATMKTVGFVAYDIILKWNRPLDNALGQADIVFVREDGRFRQDHSYSTGEQLETLFGLRPSA